MRLFVSRVAIAVLLHYHLDSAAAQACSVNLDSSYPVPVVADGYSARLVAGGLSSPRGILLDKNKNLLVVEARKGIKHITISADDGATCVTIGDTKTLVSDNGLTHGIELSGDGKTLYASSSDKVYSWTYDADGATVSDQRTLIQNMTNQDHVTRTLLLSKKNPSLLLVSRGSGDNLDDLAADESSGISQLRAFNLSALGPSQTYNYPTDGILLGWGLRNSVGVAEHPITGGVYTVENSADQLRRLGVDIHEDDPGEELNFHGFLNSTDRRGNYGYPHCFAVWSTSIPSLGSMKVGSQFSLTPDDDAAITDDACNGPDFVPPRLTFQAHVAPLDIKFDPAGDTAYVTLHGSWNRDTPAGYKLVSLAFRDGEPVEPPDSTTAAVNVLSNRDTSSCPSSCFRPVGLAVDAAGRLFMTSDATGEIYVVQRGEGNSGAGIDDQNTGSTGRAPTAGFLALAAVTAAFLI